MSLYLYRHGHFDPIVRAIPGRWHHAYCCSKAAAAYRPAGG
jgi:hypothetical protein